MGQKSRDLSQLCLFSASSRSLPDRNYPRWATDVLLPSRVTNLAKFAHFDLFSASSSFDPVLTNKKHQILLQRGRSRDHLI